MVDISQYSAPVFTRPITGWTMTRITHDRYYMFDSDKRGWHQGNPRPGYNAQNPRPVPEVIKLDTDPIRMRPLIVKIIAD